jgi:glycosyltransferase involved in cell wall biosynthesis
MVALVLVVALLLFVLFIVQRESRTLRDLPKLPVAPPQPNAAPVSVIIPARNEARNLARCLDGVLCQMQLPAEIIIVDDGSTDDTAAIAQRYAIKSVLPIHVIAAPQLPEGWTGKCNACWHAAQQATGDWLLFLDADTAPQPALIASLLAGACQHALAAASVMPFVETGTPAEKMVLPITWQFTLTLFPVLRQFNPETSPDTALANGQCLLVRRNTYFESGGHSAVHDKLIEDAAIAKLLRSKGHRLGMFVALEQLRVRPYQSFAEVVEGLMKQANAGRQMSGPRGLLIFADVLAITALPPLMLLWLIIASLASVSMPIVIALLCALAANGVALWHWRRMLKQLFDLPAANALLMPLGALLYIGIIGSGIVRVESKKGVTWKGRRYDG